MSNKRKKLLSQSQGMRTNLKMALVIGAASLSGLVALLLVVFNVSKREVLRAAGAMEFTSAEVIQDTTSVLRGSTTNPVIAILVEAKGASNNVKLNSFLLSFNGSSRPVSKNIENIKLFYTGNDQHFNTSSQVNITLPTASEGDFKIELNKPLQLGKNYFWLTADVKANALPNAKIDAELRSLVIASTPILPVMSAAGGSKTIRGNTAYYSTGNLDAGNPQSWNKDRTGRGAVLNAFTDSAACYFIQPGHQMTLSSMREMPIIAMEEASKLEVNERVKIQELNVMFGAILQFNAIEIGDKCIAQMKVNDGGNFIYNGTGIFPVSKPVFAKGATAVFYKYGNQTFEPGIVWGNILVDAKSAPALNIAETIKDIRGNLELKNTGGNPWFVNGVSTISIKGSFIVSGGIFEGAHVNNSKVNLNIGNDLIVREGVLKDVENTYTSSAHTIYNVGGDVIFTGGKINIANAESEGSALFLSGLENKSVKWLQKESAEVILCNVTIKSEKEVFLKGEKFGNITKGKTLLVERNAKLWCGTGTVHGDGKFVLSDQATLGVGHVKGINSMQNDGNILTTERVFNSGANYVYYTATTPQLTGVFTTLPKEGSVRNLIVKKDAPGQSVVLSSNFFVTEQVKIGMGELNKGRYSLKLADVTETSSGKMH